MEQLQRLCIINSSYSGKPMSYSCVQDLIDEIRVKGDTKVENLFYVIGND